MYFMLHVMVKVDKPGFDVFDIKQAIEAALPEGLEHKIEVDQFSFSAEDVFSKASQLILQGVTL